MAFAVRKMTNFNSIGKLYRELVNTFHSAQAALTADTGSAQAGATALSKAINRVATVGTAGDSCVLPAAVASLTVIVKNASATSMDVFPASGDAINALGANAAYAVAGAKAVLFFCSADGQWDTILTA